MTAQLKYCLLVTEFFIIIFVIINTLFRHGKNISYKIKI